MSVSVACHHPAQCMQCLTQRALRSACLSGVAQSAMSRAEQRAHPPAPFSAPSPSTSSPMRTAAASARSRASPAAAPGCRCWQTCDGRVRHSQVCVWGGDMQASTNNPAAATHGQAASPPVQVQFMQPGEVPATHLPPMGTPSARWHCPKSSRSCRITMSAAGGSEGVAPEFLSCHSFSLSVS